MSWCSRAAVLLTVGFALACGGGGEDAELEKALLESRLREAEMRAELAEAKASGAGEEGGGQPGAASKASGSATPAASSTGSASKTDSTSTASGSASGGSDAVSTRTEPSPKEPSSGSSSASAGKEAASTPEDDLLGDLEDLDDDDDGGGLGAKLRDAVGSDVTVEGDARVVLISSKGERTQLPAKVAPGKYDIEATFGGRAPVIVGNTSVKVGSSTVISCNPRMFICRAQ